MAGQGSRSLRQANTALVVHELRVAGPTSRADLARRTGLAKQTVSTIVASLLADGVVRERGRGEPEPGGGRPATVLEYAADRAFVAAVELGVGRTRVVLADALGTPVEVRELRRPAGRSAGRRPEPVVDLVCAALDEVLSGRGGAGRLQAVGISVTGLVQPATGTCVLAPNLGWRDVPVAALFASRMGDVPVVVRGAAQCSMVAEHREGAAVGEDDVVLLFEDEGVGAAVVERGRLLDGADGTAGELGHCAWPGATDRCGCGRRGCVETLASGPAVRRAVERSTGRRVPRRSGVPTFQALADVDDPQVDVAAGEAGRVLGTAASWLVALTSPRLLVLSGSLGPGPAALRVALEEAVRSREIGEHRTRIVAGALGADAALRGATLLALDEARVAQGG